MIKNCRCGKTPVIQKQFVQFGQGSNGYGYYIECSCGMRTRSIDNYSNSEEDCIKEAEAIWDKWAE